MSCEYDVRDFSKLKVGDKIKIHSSEYFKKNWNISLDVFYPPINGKSTTCFVDYMIEFCGKIMTISEKKSYAFSTEIEFQCLEGKCWNFSEDMIEQAYPKEEK